MKKILIAIGLILSIGVAHADGIRGVVVQGNGDRAQFERALRLASNMHEVLPKAKFEVVIFGPTVKLLDAFGPEATLIGRVQREGIQVIACGRSLKTDHVNEGDLAPDVRVVPFGAVHILKRQHQGWEYFKP
jgi:intracellular sulfur oxidation DsrE/DsrF family protein